MVISVSKNSGFTLIELLVVIAIIGILAATVLAALGTARESSKVSRAQSEMQSIKTAMELLANQTGLYPHKQSAYCPPRSAVNNEIDLSLSSAGLIATDGTFPRWNGPYIASVIDPWGRPYFLDEDNICVGTAKGCNGVDNLTGTMDSSVLMSCGPNGTLGASSYGNNGVGCAYDSDNVVLILCSI